MPGTIWSESRSKVCQKGVDGIVEHVVLECKKHDMEGTKIMLVFLGEMGCDVKGMTGRE